jgi:outer membrane lipoprotein-sorting protein
MKVNIIFFGLLFYVANFTKLFAKTFELSFSQKIKSQLTNRERVSIGKLIYQYPKKIRLDFNDLLIVSNGEKSWYYTKPFQKGEEGTLEVIDRKKNESDPLSFIFDTVYEGKSPTKEVTYAQVGKKILMNFTGSSIQKYSLQNVELVFKEAGLKFQDLTSLHLIKNDGQKVDISLESRSIAPKIGPETFVFDLKSKN